MINQGDVLTLNDNNTYSVVASTTIDNVNYIYIIDQNDYTNVMFCKYDNKKGLEEVVDKKLVEKLMLIFGKKLKNLKKIMSEEK